MSLVPNEEMTNRPIVTIQKKGFGHSKLMCKDSTVAQQLTNISATKAILEKIFKKLLLFIFYYFNITLLFGTLFQPSKITVHLV